MCNFHTLMLGGNFCKSQGSSRPVFYLYNKAYIKGIFFVHQRDVIMSCLSDFAHMASHRLQLHWLYGIRKE